MRSFIQYNKMSIKFSPDPKPEKIEKKKKGLNKSRKPTGELEIFKQIWEERGPYSQINQEFLGEFNVCFFSHILPKGKYPKFRLNKENIILKSFDQHYNWEHNKRGIINNPEWNKIFELEEILKIQYKDIVVK